MAHGSGVTPFLFETYPYHSGIKAKYNVEVGGKVVIITERPDNPGMSITNAAEAVLSELVRLREDITEESVFVEHYPRRENGYGDVIEETYDLIVPTWLHEVAPAYIGQPKCVSVAWRPLSKQQVLDLKGGRDEG